MGQTLEFRSGTLDGEISIELSEDIGKYSFRLWDGDGDAMVQLDFSEPICKEVVHETGQYIHKMLCSEMSEPYFGMSWGRVEFLLKNDKSIDLIAYLCQRDEYEEDASYLRIYLEESIVSDIETFLMSVDKADTDHEYEDDIPLTYSVGVFRNNQQVLELGLGSEAVNAFYDKALSGIEGAVSLKRFWGYNINVTIKGSDLLTFIKKEYPAKEQTASEIISGKESETFTIIGCDLS